MTDPADILTSKLRLLVRDEMSDAVDASAMIVDSLLFALQEQGLANQQVFQSFKQNMDKMLKTQQKSGGGDLLARTKLMIDMITGAMKAN